MDDGDSEAEYYPRADLRPRSRAHRRQRGPARRRATLGARQVSGRPDRCETTGAFLREYSYKRLLLS